MPPGSASNPAAKAHDEHVGAPAWPLLHALAEALEAALDREEQAEAVATVLAGRTATAAVRWWGIEPEAGPAEVVTLAAAGASLSAVLRAEPEAWLRRVEVDSLATWDDLSSTLPDLPDDAELWRDLVVAAGLRSLALVPLTAGDQVAGVLALYDPAPAAWPDDNPALLLTGRLAGLRLAAASHRPVAQDTNGAGEPETQAEALRQVLVRLHASRESAATCTVVAEQAAKLLRAPWVMVARATENAGELCCCTDSETFTIGLIDEMVLAETLVQGQMLSDQVLEARSEVGRRALAAGAERALTLPMQFGEEILGVVQVGYPAGHTFDAAERELANWLAFHAALALREAALYERQQEALSRLQAAQESLTKGAKLRALAQMAGGVAHEFNNALGGILGRAQMLQRQTQDHRIHKGLRTILEIGWRAAETVRRLQEFTRERDDEDLETIAIPSLWERVAARARECARHFSQQTGQPYHLELEPGHLEGTVRASADELVEAVENVVVNALEATPGGGVVTLHAHAGEGLFRLHVVDRGRGMSEEEQQSIFDPFYTTKAESGVGLGLSVTYGILSRHHGEVDVESAPGRGTTISLLLPLADTAGTTAPEQAKPARRILVIDDEEALCEVLAELFSGAGFEVESCAGGREGIELFHNGEFDLVCTDLRTLDISGWEVIRAVRESRRDVPVMLLTGYRDQLPPEQIEASGVDLVLGKPFGLQQVMEAAESLLSRDRSRG